MARQQLTDLDFNNVARIINLPNPTNDQDAATMAYVKSLLEGLSWKDNVRAASTGNINLNAPGSTIGGVTPAVGDRVLLKDQTAVAENGIYIYNGASTPMTRAPDANTADELESAVVTVDEGTHAGTSWRQTNVNFTLGTDPVNWVTFGTAAPPASESTAGIIKVASQSETDNGLVDNAAVTPLKLANWAGRIRKIAAYIGDGSATQFTVNHNLNTRDIHVAIYRNSGAYDQVNVDIEHTTTNTVTIRFASAPAANAFRVVVMG
jgi:hypothetical protein